MPKKIDPAVSAYMRSLNAKRKNKVGGFKSAEVQRRIKNIKKAKQETPNAEDMRPM